MSDWLQDDTILARLRSWLEQTRNEGQMLATDGALGQPAEAAEGFGLVDLIREFTALRHEVKLQTKSARGLDEQLAAAVVAMEETSRQFRAVEPQEAEAARRAALPLVESMADLDEVLQRAQTAAESACIRLVDEAAAGFPQELHAAFAGQPVWRRWIARPWYERVRGLWLSDAENRGRILDALVQGYSLVRKRLERAMAREGIHRIQCVGLPVDPHAMNVVEVVEVEGQEPGIVIEEIRPGYRWKDKVIRFAEVRATQDRQQNP